MCSLTSGSQGRHPTGFLPTTNGRRFQRSDFPKPSLRRLTHRRECQPHPADGTGRGSPNPTVLRTPAERANRPSRPREAHVLFRRALGSVPKKVRTRTSLGVRTQRRCELSCSMVNRKGGANGPARLPVLGPQGWPALTNLLRARSRMPIELDHQDGGTR